MVGPLGRVGQRLLLRVVLLAPNQIIVRLNLGPRISLGEVKQKRKGDTENSATDVLGTFFGARLGPPCRSLAESRHSHQPPRESFNLCVAPMGLCMRLLPRPKSLHVCWVLPCSDSGSKTISKFRRAHPRTPLILSSRTIMGSPSHETRKCACRGP